MKFCMTARTLVMLATVCNSNVRVGGGDTMSTRRTVHWSAGQPRVAGHSRHGNGGLTIHERAWAYCDGAGVDDAHEWKETGGVPLESLVRWTAPNGVSIESGRPLAGVAAATNVSPRASRKTSGVHRT